MVELREILAAVLDSVQHLKGLTFEKESETASIIIGQLISWYTKNGGNNLIMPDRFNLLVNKGMTREQCFERADALIKMYGGLKHESKPSTPSAPPVPSDAPYENLQQLLVDVLTWAHEYSSDTRLWDRSDLALHMEHLSHVCACLINEKLLQHKSKVESAIFLEELCGPVRNRTSWEKIVTQTLVVITEDTDPDRWEKYAATLTVNELDDQTRDSVLKNGWVTKPLTETKDMTLMRLQVEVLYPADKVDADTIAKHFTDALTEGNNKLTHLAREHDLTYSDAFIVPHGLHADIPPMMPRSDQEAINRYMYLISLASEVTSYGNSDSLIEYTGGGSYYVYCGANRYEYKDVPSRDTILAIFKELADGYDAVQKLSSKVQHNPAITAYAQHLSAKT